MMDFVLLGFTDIPQFQWFLFGIFLVIYVIILLGNGTIILITRVDATSSDAQGIFSSAIFPS